MKSKFSDEDISKAKKQLSAKKPKAVVNQTPKKGETKKSTAGGD